MFSSYLKKIVVAALMLAGTAPAVGAAGGPGKMPGPQMRFDRYELSVLYDATGYFTLSVFEKEEGGAEQETVYGLRRASMYLPADYRSGDWMLFFGERPPVYEAAGLVAVSKHPWLIRFKDGEWSAARVSHRYGKDGVYTLLRVQPGKDGSPELVYLNGDGEEDINSPDGWSKDSKLTVKPEKTVRIKRVKFVSR